MSKRSEPVIGRRSSMPAPGSDLGSNQPVRRVRDQARDGLAVMAFSACTSVAIGLLLAFLTGLGK
jgi:hypothetical protein